MSVDFINHKKKTLNKTIGIKHRYISRVFFIFMVFFRYIVTSPVFCLLQNCLYVWIRDHRQHHKYSDTNGDPHNATRGFFFSHIGWLMVRKHPDVFEKGKTIDMSDIEMDPYAMFQKKWVVRYLFDLSVNVGNIVNIIQTL